MAGSNLQTLFGQLNPWAQTEKTRKYSQVSQDSSSEPTDEECLEMAKSTDGLLASRDSDYKKDGTRSPTSDGDDGIGEVEMYVIDREAERKLLWKFDIYVLPMLSIMYLFNSIDKSNLGNAKTDGITDDLHFTGNQYNILMSIFFIPFIFCGPPMNMLTKRYGASRVLPLAMIFFGSMAMLSAAATGFRSLMITRWFLGMAESGFYPGVIFYLTTFYKRSELAGRLSIFYAASEVAGAFTGLIAYGVFQIKAGPFKGWQYLFLVEGSLTICAGIAALLVLPKSAATAYFITEDEKFMARMRLSHDSSSVVDAKFDFKQAMRVFTDDLLWPFYMSIGICLGVPLFSVANFLPQIVARLGYDTVKTNLYTVAPNIVGAIFVVAVALSSDYTGDRSLHLAACLLLTSIGFVILAGIDITQNVGLGYFCCFLLCAGSYISSPLWSTWFSNNLIEENQRAVLTPVLVAVSNSMGLVSANIFTEASAPNYVVASVISACCGAVGAVLVIGVGFFMKYDNRRRDREQNVRLRACDVPTSSLQGGQKDPRWRWMGGVP